MNDSISILQAWEQSVLDNYLSQMDAKGVTASGRTRSTSKVVMRENGGSIEVPYYNYWVLNGRKPNKDQNIDSLRKWVGWAGSTFFAEWVKQKGLPLGLSYAIAWKIGRNGYVAKNLTVVTKAQENDLLKKIGVSYMAEIKSNLQKSWQR